MENIAIKYAFKTAASYPGDGRALFVRRFFDHPAICAESYFSALLNSYRPKDRNEKLFYWLLERADRQDLEEFEKDKCFFKRMPLEFQEAMNRALQTVGTESRPGITHRQGITRQRLATIKEALEGDIPKDLFNIIIKYYF